FAKSTAVTTKTETMQIERRKRAGAQRRPSAWMAAAAGCSVVCSMRWRTLRLTCARRLRGHWRHAPHDPSFDEPRHQRRNGGKFIDALAKSLWLSARDSVKLWRYELSRPRSG